LPSSTRTREVMETLVATRADTTTMLSMSVKPSCADGAYPKRKGTMTPTVPFTKETEPTRLNSWNVISSPAANRMRMPPISPNARTMSFIWIMGLPLMASREPKARDPEGCLRKAHPRPTAVSLWQKARREPSLRKPICIWTRLPAELGLSLPFSLLFSKGVIRCPTFLLLGNFLYFCLGAI
jgi:hypothetical protein